jgi:short-subunit dehydrogenase
MRKILIVGATSAIAEHTARLFAADGDALFLVARDETKLAGVAADLEVRGARMAATRVMDADDLEAHAEMLAAAEKALGGLDTVLIAYGTLPDQTAAQANPKQTVRAWQTNAVSVIALVTAIANRFEQAGGGLIAVISSVAGDRGRASNYVYGSAKAGDNTFLDGLRHRLHGTDVAVLTIRPGLVDTPMTAGLDKSKLFAAPDRVAADIHKAIAKRKAICYTPGFWRLIMAIVRSLPRPLFHRTGL